MTKAHLLRSRFFPISCPCNALLDPVKYSATSYQYQFSHVPCSNSLFAKGYYLIDIGVDSFSSLNPGLLPLFLSIIKMFPDILEEIIITVSKKFVWIILGGINLLAKKWELEQAQQHQITTSSCQKYSRSKVKAISHKVFTLGVSLIIRLEHPG